MSLTFNERIWELCKKIPPGKISTYKEIAHALGTKAYRAVGNALNKNPYNAWNAASSAVIVPCHRVVNADGSLGGFAHGQEKKKRLLEKEGIVVRGGEVVDFEKRLFRF